MSADDLRERLWRARRRHHHIDAQLREATGGWELSFLHDDQPLLAWTFVDRATALADADRRLRDLLRVGWNVHW